MSFLSGTINFLRGKRKCPVCMRPAMEKLGYMPAQSRPEQYGFTEYWCSNCYYCKRTEFIVLNSTAAMYQPEREAILKRETECRVQFKQDPIQSTCNLKKDFENHCGYFERDPAYMIVMSLPDVG